MPKSYMGMDESDFLPQGADEKRPEGGDTVRASIYKFSLSFWYNVVPGLAGFFCLE